MPSVARLRRGAVNMKVDKSKDDSDGGHHAEEEMRKNSGKSETSSTFDPVELNRSAGESEKEAAAPEVFFLSGNLTSPLTPAGKIRCHVIRGKWWEKKYPDVTQRFELVRTISPNEDFNGFPRDGEYKGSYNFDNSSFPERATLTFEQKGDASEGIFSVNGTGRNEFGLFELFGSAKKNAGSGPALSRYNISLQKEYVDMDSIPAPSEQGKSEAATPVQRGEGKSKDIKRKNPTSTDDEARNIPKRARAVNYDNRAELGKEVPIIEKSIFSIESISSSSQGDNVRLGTDQEKRGMKQSLMFTKVLMKYLQQRDAKMHTKARAQIKECYDKNKSGDPNFQNLPDSVKARLRSTVGEHYWKEAHEYLGHYLRQKRVDEQKVQAQQQFHQHPITTQGTIAKAQKISCGEESEYGGFVNAGEENEVSGENRINKPARDEFLTFVGVLLKHLENSDVEMHAKATAQILECKEKKKTGDPNFQNLADSVMARLRSTVGELHWNKADKACRAIATPAKLGEGRVDGLSKQTVKSGADAAVKAKPPLADHQQDTQAQDTQNAQNDGVDSLNAKKPSFGMGEGAPSHQVSQEHHNEGRHEQNDDGIGSAHIVGGNEVANPPWAANQRRNGPVDSCASNSVSIKQEDKDDELEADCHFQLVVSSKATNLIIKVPRRRDLSFGRLRCEIEEEGILPFTSFQFTLHAGGATRLSSKQETNWKKWSIWEYLTKQGDGSSMKPYQVFIEETV